MHLPAFLYRINCATRAVVLTVLLSSSPHGQAAAPNAVPSVGTMHDIPHVREKPNPAQHCKILFNVKTRTDNSDGISPELRAIAGIVNTYRIYGVPTDRLEVAAVFHGATIVLVVRDAVYSRRYAGITLLVADQLFGR